MAGFSPGEDFLPDVCGDENEWIALMNSSVLCSSTSVFTLSTELRGPVMDLSFCDWEREGNSFDDSGCVKLELKILSKKLVLLTTMGSLSR